MKSKKQILKIAGHLSDPFRVQNGKKFKLKKVDPGDTLVAEVGRQGAGRRRGCRSASRPWPSCRTGSMRRTSGPCC